MENKYQEALDVVIDRLEDFSGNDQKRYILPRASLNVLQELIDKNSKQHPKLIPCKCGCNKRQRQYNHIEKWVKLICAKCGYVVAGKNEVDVVNKWNEEMKNEQI